MNTAKKAFRIFASASFLVGVMALAGCGSGGGQDDMDKTPDLAGFAKAPALDFAMACVPTCATDSQCQDSCAPPTSGVNCCDTQTSACFVSQTTVCPAPPDMSSGATPYL